MIILTQIKNNIDLETLNSFNLIIINYYSLNIKDVKKMQIKQKSMSRSSWTRILDKEYVIMDITYNNSNGKIGLLYIKDVKEPLIKSYNNEKIVIVDKGYYWLQIGLKDKNYWITAIYDNNKNLIQYYIDITRNNYINSNDPYFEDLFLDVVIFPNGNYITLDINELNQALSEKIITEQEFNMALDTANDVTKSILSNITDFDKLCFKYLNYLVNKIKHKII